MEKSRICNLCLQEKKLIVSHIIPKGFYTGRYDIFGEKYSRKITQGIYDKTILCSECDHSIGKYDQYAIEVLRDRQPEFLDQFSLIIYRNIEHQKLKLFFMSLLFRMHIAEYFFFKDFKLHEKFIIDLREKIHTQEVEEREDYFFVLSKMEFPVPDEALMPPSIREVEGVMFAEVSLPYRFMIYIKIDNSEKIPSVFNFNCEDSILVVFNRGHKFSKEFYELAQERAKIKC